MKLSTYFVNVDQSLEKFAYISQPWFSVVPKKGGWDFVHFDRYQTEVLFFFAIDQYKLAHNCKVEGKIYLQINI